MAALVLNLREAASTSFVADVFASANLISGLENGSAPFQMHDCAEGATK